MLFTLATYDFNFGHCQTISNRKPKALSHVNFTKMDPKKNDNKWSSMPPDAKLQTLRNLRDGNHRLKSPDRLYNQDWFIGAVMEEGLEQTYINDIAFNFRN